MLRRCCLSLLCALGVSGLYLLARPLHAQPRLERWVSSLAPAPAPPAPVAPVAPAAVAPAPVAETAWIFQDRPVEPPGFQAFVREVLELQERARKGPEVQWLVFSGLNGLGNWMLGVSSALLLANLLGRGFAHLNGADDCAWMDTPMCAWRDMPGWVKDRVVQKLKKPKVEMSDTELLVVPWQGCSYKKLCKELSFKKVLVVQAGNWFGEILRQNPLFRERMSRAFQRTARDRVIWDIYGPLARWIFKPAASVQQELDGYVQANMSRAAVSVCLQGRWGLQKELEQGKICIDRMLAAPWWPRGKTVIHVVSMQSSFRRKVKAAFPELDVVWPEWDKSVSGQKDDRTGYKDMLLAGRCHVLVAPNGGSTYTYTPGAMYHSIALRDAPKKANCSDLPGEPYEKLFPEPQCQLDVDKKCSAAPSC